MGSFQNKIKNFERYYGVHLKSLRRSRRFMSLVFLTIFIIVLIFFKLSPRSNRNGKNYSIELENCMQSKLEKFSEDFKSMNAVATDWHENSINPLKEDKNEIKVDEIKINQELELSHSDKFFLPYTGNGYIGVSVLSKLGLYANHHNSLSLKINYNPLIQIYSDTLVKKEQAVIEFNKGLVHKIQCYQNNKDCISVQNTLYAHRTRPSVLIEEFVMNNPSKESVTFDLIQLGANNWNQSVVKIENINGIDFTITNGIIDVLIDNKLKHLCISIGTTRLPTSILLKEHDFNVRNNAITVVKYSTAFLTGKLENLEPVLNNLKMDVINEIKDLLSIGFNKLKKEHIDAWNNIWKSGFGISNSLAFDAMNGDQLNASIYYVLTNNRAPLIELTNGSISENHLKYHMERCYEGFSTLHAIKLWKLPLNEVDISNLSLLWMLTLQKHGCKTLIDLGVDGILQAIILSIGGLKFTHHHLDLNLNPRQIHRNYAFRRINYANLSLITIEIEVDNDNHANLFVTLNELIDSNQKFYACDAGCIDSPIELILNNREPFPVKLTNPITAILYVSSDRQHIHELKHALHVQEVDIAPPQDVNSIALHKHGHHLAGLATLFWTLFVILIIIFHLFLIKLVYRELCNNSNTADNKNGYSSYESSKKYRYTRTV